MPTNLNDLVEGLDPSVMAQINGSQLLQMQRNATPSSDRGFLIWKDDLPTVAEITAMPRLKGYLSIKVTDNPKIVYGFDLTKFNAAIDPPWTPIGVGNAAITNAMLAGGIQLSKLSIDPANPAIAGFFVRVNGAGNGYEHSEGLLDDGSVTVEKLSVDGGSVLDIIRIKEDGSALEFISPSTFINDLPNRTIVVPKLATLDLNATAIARMLVNEPGVDTVIPRHATAADIAADGIPDGRFLVSSGGRGVFSSSVIPAGARAIIREVYAADTPPNPAMYSTVWDRLLLNLTYDDPYGLVVDLTAGLVRINPGVYRLNGYAVYTGSGAGSGAKARLYDNTAAALITLSNSSKQIDGSSSDALMLKSKDITFAVQTQISIDLKANSNAARFNVLSPALGEAELYTELEILKIG